MLFQVHLQKTTGGYQARALGKPACEAMGQTREETLENIRDEIRYRVEFCPCTWVADDFVELEVFER